MSWSTLSRSPGAWALCAALCGVMMAGPIAQAQAQQTSCPQALDARAFALQSPERLLVLPAELPPGRVVLSLDRLDDGEHQELAWEPGAPGSTAKDVLLPAGCWQVSWNIQPLRSPQSPTQDRAWQPLEPWRPAPSCGAASADPRLSKALFGCASFSVQRGLQGQAQTVAQVPVLMLRAPKTSLAQAAGRWREAWSGPGLSGSLEQLAQAQGERAKVSASAALQNVSSFVMLKAQDKALESARERMLRVLKCQGARPFAQTCDLLGVVRLADLLVLGDTLQETLSADLIQYASRHLATTLKMDPVASSVLGVGLELAASFVRRGARPTDQEVAGVFIAMTSVYAQALEAEQADPVTQGAGLAIAVMSECARQRDCTGKRVFSLIRERDAYFELAQSFKLHPAWWPEKELIDFIGRGLAILKPTQKDASLERAMAISELTFMLLPRHHCHTLGVASMEECQAKHPKPLASLRSAQNLIEGAILRDPQRGLMALNEILASREDERQMMAALGSFIVQAPQDAGKDATAALAARQKSMENLVSALSKRRARKGDLVFGVHGATSLNMTAASRSFSSSSPDGMMTAASDEETSKALVLSGSVGDVFAAPISLTFGLSGQKYLSERLGVSLSLDLIELGRWVSFVEGELNEFNLASAVYPSMTLGLLMGDPDLPIFLGARAGYSPLDDAVFVGLNLGVYVPLLDFN